MHYLKRHLLVLVILIFSTTPGIAFEFRGFSDVTFTGSEKGTEFENRPLAVGQIDFFASHNIDDELDVLIEMVVESDDNGEWVIDMERLQISNYFSDALKISAGRFHNTMGYWNATYHHGAMLHTTIERPQFLNFEDDGGVLPAHLVGLWTHGWVENALGSLTYDLMIGNGSKIVGTVDSLGMASKTGTLDPNNITDDNRNKAVSLNLQYEPGNLFNAGIGAFGYYSTVNSSNLTTNIDINQLIVGGDLYYIQNDIEFISEVYSVINDDNTKNLDTTAGTGFYVQGGYEFNSIMPYARYETFQVDDNDPYFTALGFEDYNKTVLGIKYNIRGKSTLKGEVRFNENEIQKDTNTEYALQWAFLF